MVIDRDEIARARNCNGSKTMLARHALPMTILIFSATCAVSTSRGQDNGNVSIESIFASFLARQERVDCGRFEFAEEVTVPAGTYFVTASEGNSRSAGRFPLETVVQRKTRSVSFARDWLRYAYEGPQWTPKIQDFVQQTYVTVFDGQDSRSFYGNAFGDHRLGFIHKPERGHTDSDNLYIEPILRHFRPLHRSMGRISSSSCSLRDQGGEIDGIKCVILEQTSGGSKETFWLDPQREFIILRTVREYGRGSALVQLDVSYSHDKDNGWVPAKWRGIWKHSKDNGRTLTLKEGFAAEVTRQEISIPLGREEFQIRFPPGTLVEDQRSGEGYIVGEGGSKRIITDAERSRNVTYADLVNSRSGEAGIPQVNSWKSRIPVLFGLILIVVFIVLIWYRMKKRAG